MKITVIGVGNMGSALLGGILIQGFAKKENIRICDALFSRLSDVAGKLDVRGFAKNSDAVAGSDIVILAVKPNDVKAALESANIDKSQLLISIAAGFKISSIAEIIGDDKKIVRAMPNTPALVGESITAVAYNENVQKNEKTTAVTLLKTVGEVVEIPEDKLDAATGLSGSGPAYILTVIEAMAAGGVKMGLTMEVALKLASYTVLGTSRLLVETKEHPAVLKDKVTSPGGTTIAGLHKLEEFAIRAGIISAVEAATAKSIQLGETLKGG